ncbi:LysE family translocator [Psychrobacter sp. T6-1]|uniref:LysE family translocator n=1 Tax=Psychrobacter sp. T6-1 TaxID=3457447 RepID=UPI003FD15DAD
MSWHLFSVFFITTFFISATPGPNMLLAFQYGLNYGVKRTLWTLAGLSLGLFILLLSTLLGLDVISRQSPWLLDIIKIIGALYLIYLGAVTWRDTGESDGLVADAKQMSADIASTQKRGVSDWRLFRIGVWVSLSNPKAILFFAAFFPKFIDFAAPLWSQYILLTLGFFLSETIWQIIYTIGGKQLAGWLEVGNRLAWLNRICGVIFILIALALLIEVASPFVV